MTQHHPRDLIALKTAFRLLVQGVGGGEAAGAALRYRPSHLSEAASPHCQDRWPRVDHIAELEALAGEPFVTAQLARLSGCTLLPMPRARGEEGAALAAVLSSAGELGARTVAALSDGALNEAERADLVARLGALKRAAAHAEALLAVPTLAGRGVSGGLA